MKKTVITIVAVVAAVAAHAQTSGAEARFMADCWQGFSASNNKNTVETTTPTPTSSKPASVTTYTPSGATWGREIPSWGTWNHQRQPVEGTQLGPVSFSAESGVQSEVALGDAISAIGEQAAFEEAQRQARLAAASGSSDQIDFVPAGANFIARVETPTVTNKHKTDSNWFNRLMGFEKYEGESDEEWQSRLYYMSIK
jgi:hypothetical protein